MSVEDDSSALLGAIAAGDRHTTARLYRQAYPMVAHWIGTHGGDDDDAADMFQEAMVVLFGKAQDAAFRLTCAPATYLYAVARNLWLRRLQNQSRFSITGEPEGGFEDEGGADYGQDVREHEEREERFDRLEVALQQIGEPCASLLRAFYHEGKSMQDISAASGYSNADTAKTQKYKCLNRLKKLFFGSDEAAKKGD